MPNHVVVDSHTHRRTRVVTDSLLAYADVGAVVAVIPAEFSALLSAYPIFLRKSAATGRFEPCVLLGFAAEENLFVEGGRWDGPYVPLDVQRRPFLIRPQSEEEAAGGQPRLTVTLDMDSPRVQEREGEILFDEAGRPSRYLDRVASILRALVEGGAAAYDYAAKLAELELIEPVRIEAAFIDGSDAKLDGLYAIKADELRRVYGERLQELQARGYLEWAYWQVGSLTHVSGLIARRNRRLVGAKA